MQTLTRRYRPNRSIHEFLFVSFCVIALTSIVSWLIIHAFYRNYDVSYKIWFPAQYNLTNNVNGAVVPVSAYTAVLPTVEIAFEDFKRNFSSAEVTLVRPTRDVALEEGGHTVCTNTLLVFYVASHRGVNYKAMEKFCVNESTSFTLDPAGTVTYHVAERTLSKFLLCIWSCIIAFLVFKGVVFDGLRDRSFLIRWFLKMFSKIYDR